MVKKAESCGPIVTIVDDKFVANAREEVLFLNERARELVIRRVAVIRDLAKDASPYALSRVADMCDQIDQLLRVL